MSSQEPPNHAHTIPGFDFLSKLSQHGATGLGGAAAALPGLPPMSHWIAPVFDPEELDKRIHDLRAVHFWLDQNTKALAATIQALELQKMTLLTLRGMNVSMQEMAESFVAKPAPAAEAATGAARTTAGWPQSAQSAQAEPAPAPARLGRFGRFAASRRWCGLRRWRPLRQAQVWPQRTRPFPACSRSCPGA